MFWFKNTLLEGKNLCSIWKNIRSLGYLWVCLLGGLWKYGISFLSYGSEIVFFLNVSNDLDVFLPLFNLTFLNFIQ